ncbi:hypothetical protein Tco_0063107 [Tanacetum coccineum]
MLRLCHRLIACSIAGRSQAPKKVLEVVHFREEVGEMIYGDLLVIDMAELVAATSAPKAAEDAPVADEGAPAVPAPVHAPQLPHPVARPARTMSQRLAMVEEYVHEIRGALGEQREILDSMAHDFS